MNRTIKPVILKAMILCAGFYLAIFSKENHFAFIVGFMTCALALGMDENKESK